MLQRQPRNRNTRFKARLDQPRGFPVDVRAVCNEDSRRVRRSMASRRAMTIASVMPTPAISAQPFPRQHAGVASRHTSKWGRSLRRRAVYSNEHLFR
ncbi:hypothetical protein GGD56_006738 [Rhizobium mongolense]|uniref:Uncharacterized protein n=1 Tax=Rhizobium mongolense TaxID=57676 RepID=A0ABR6IY45_9HYPH|nr:hypothetical protein [Rhizobium mongolense]